MAESNAVETPNNSADGVADAWQDSAKEAAALADKLIRGATPESGVEPEVSNDALGSGVDEGGKGEKPSRVAESRADAKDAAKDHAVKDAPAKADSKADDEDSDRLEVVLRDRRQRRQATLEAQRKAEELERKAQELETQFGSLQQALKEDPIGALRQLGYTEEQIAKRLLGATENPKESAVERELKAIKAKLEAREAAEARAREEASKAEINQAIEATKRGFVGYVAEAKFPLLQSFYDDSPEELAERAFQIATTYRERTGKETSYKAVAEYLESQLERRYTTIQERSAKAAQASKAPPATQAKQRTLTPSDSAPRGSAPRRPVAELSEDEARNEAMKMANEILRR